MAVDGTSIRNDIDNNLANKGYRGIRIVNVITALKNLVDWVTGAVNGNLSTWLRVSDNQPGGANADSVYRTGAVQFAGGASCSTQTGPGATMASTPIGSQYALQVQGKNGGAAFMEFHVPGLLIHQLGVDSDGILKLRQWDTNSVFPVILSGASVKLALANSLENRKIVLYGDNNDHQFFGFGINANVLRYQVGGVGVDHVFFAGTSAVTSKELMRIAGNGNVSIGDASPSFRLKVVQDNPANGWLVVVSNSTNAPERTGAKILFDQASLSGWAIGSPGGNVDAFVIEGSGGVERMRIDSTGEATFGGPLAFGGRSKNGWPSAADVPTNKIVAYKNTATNERRLYWNDNGNLTFTTFGT